jgi:hypothetical protein
MHVKTLIHQPEEIFEQQAIYNLILPALLHCFPDFLVVFPSVIFVQVGRLDVGW